MPSAYRKHKPRDLRRLIEAARARSKSDDLRDLDRQLLSRLAWYLEKALSRGFRGDTTRPAGMPEMPAHCDETN